MIHSLDSLLLKTLLVPQGKSSDKSMDPKDLKSPLSSGARLSLPNSAKINSQKSGSVPVNKQELVSYTKIKNSFFNESKTNQWKHATETSDPKSVEWKPLWNFLFPEIQWTKNRIHFQDKKKKRSFEGFFQKEGDADYFCAIFESIITGKIWILFYLPKAGKEGILEIKANFPHTLARLKKDIPKLKPSLFGIEEIRFFIEPNSNLVGSESEFRGIFA